MTDWPSWKHFSFDKEHPLTYDDYGLKPHRGSHGFSKRPVTVYAEDIYTGYRYFDTFGVKPLYSFGFGLSYTDFDIRFLQAEKHSDGLSVCCEVQNIGTCAGKETVQLYAAAEGMRCQRPNKELIAFTKTRLLQPSEMDRVILHVPWEAFRSYNEKSASEDHGMGAGNSAQPPVYGTHFAGAKHHDSLEPHWRNAGVWTDSGLTIALRRIGVGLLLCYRVIAP